MRRPASVEKTFHHLKPIWRKFAKVNSSQVLLLQGVCPRESNGLRSIVKIAAFSVYEVLRAKKLKLSAGFLTMKEEKLRTPRVNATCKGPFIFATDQTLPAYHCTIGVEVLCFEHMAEFRFEPLLVPHLSCAIKRYF